MNQPIRSVEPLPEIVAIRAFIQEQREMLDRLDRVISEHDRKRRGNPLYDKEWSL